MACRALEERVRLCQVASEHVAQAVEGERPALVGQLGRRLPYRSLDEPHDPRCQAEGGHREKLVRIALAYRAFAMKTTAKKVGPTNPGKVTLDELVNTGIVVRPPNDGGLLSLSEDVRYSLMLLHCRVDATSHHEHPLVEPQLEHT